MPVHAISIKDMNKILINLQRQERRTEYTEKEFDDLVFRKIEESPIFGVHTFFTMLFEVDCDYLFGLIASSDARMRQTLESVFGIHLESQDFSGRTSTILSENSGTESESESMTGSSKEKVQYCSSKTMEQPDFKHLLKLQSSNLSEINAKKRFTANPFQMFTFINVIHFTVRFYVFVLTSLCLLNDSSDFGILKCLLYSFV